MRRKTSTTPSKIYTYGLLEPDADTFALVDHQLRLANWFRNKLVEVERLRRKEYRDGLSSFDPQVGALAAEVEQLFERDEKVYRLRKSSRLSEQQAAELKAEASELNKQLKTKMRLLQELRKAVVSDNRYEGMVKEVSDRSYARSKTAYNDSPLYWGTKLFILKAHDQVKQQKGADPKFRSYDGQGRVGVQLQGGHALPRIFSRSNTLLQIDPVDLAVFAGTRAERRRGCRTTVRIRVGSEKGKPVWALFELVMHRPMPSDSVVKEAWVRRSKTGSRFRYELQLVLESDQFRSAAPRPGLTCGLNVNWRRLEDESLRICYVVDEDGEHSEVRMPKQIQKRLDHADSLRSIRDGLLEDVLKQFSDLLPSHELPEWLTERLSGDSGRLSFRSWKSHGKLASVVIAWRNRRWPGDDQLFDLIESWRVKDKHLWNWEACERKTAVLHRREHYRKQAEALCRKYSVVVYPDVNFSKLAKKEDNELPPSARKNRQQSAPASFLDAIKLYAPKLGVTLVKCEAKDVTRRCSYCGSVEKVDRTVIVHHCSCGRSWDQDANASLNALQRHASGPEPDGSLGLAAE